jgi:hypothetical protein
MSQKGLVAPIILSIGAGMGGAPDRRNSHSIGGGAAVACYAPSEFSWSSSPGDDEQKFDRLADEWRKQTGHLSSVAKMAMHESYQQIIGMGSKAVPLMLKSLERQPEHWFWALHMITGADPVPADSKGKLREMAQAWIQWGRSNGYDCQ